MNNVQSQSKGKTPQKSIDASFNTISGSKTIKDRKFSTIVKVDQKLNYDSEDEEVNIKKKTKGSSIFNSDETETGKTGSLSPKMKGSNFKSLRGSVKNENKSILSKTQDVINTKPTKKVHKNNFVSKLEEPGLREDMTETDQINQKYLIQLYNLEKERMEAEEKFKRSIEANQVQFQQQSLQMAEQVLLLSRENKNLRRQIENDTSMSDQGGLSSQQLNSML